MAFSSHLDLPARAALRNSRLFEKSSSVAFARPIFPIGLLIPLGVSACRTPRLSLTPVGGVKTSVWHIAVQVFLLCVGSVPVWVWDRVQSLKPCVPPV
jgi:hypothetical protein